MDAAFIVKHDSGAVRCGEAVDSQGGRESSRRTSQGCVYLPVASTGMETDIW
jgi:hypothetical protein